jgi:hypothetical protein
MVPCLHYLGINKLMHGSGLRLVPDLSISSMIKAVIRPTEEGFKAGYSQNDAQKPAYNI